MSWYVPGHLPARSPSVLLPLDLCSLEPCLSVAPWFSDQRSQSSLKLLHLSTPLGSTGLFLRVSSGSSVQFSERCVREETVLWLLVL